MTSVQQRIDDSARKVGNKAANLQELQALCQKISSLNVPVHVPELYALEHDMITSHLDKSAPDWRNLWSNFVQEQGKAELGSLAPQALAKLQLLRALIVKTFETYPLSSEELEQYLGTLPDKSLLMVRSTSKEDSVDLANPGGNESIAAVAPDKHAISKAMGEVVASYFSEKSLKQRLISNDNITEFPFMPVLLQRMIGEPLLGEINVAAVIRSGVMYTGKAGTQIQLAPGHGELIVNSKAPFDTFYVTREQAVHAEIYRKTHRLVPIEVEEGGKKKRKLQFHKNPPELQNNPAVPATVAQAIAKVGRSIEQHYGMPMDVEFVYHPEENVIYLVQARPIPKGDLKLVVPSSIPPEKLSEIKRTSELYSAEVITPAGSAAQVITAPDALLICDTIGQALDHYLQQKNSAVKAVIVREMAPETSHEAAQFKAKAIPVLAVDDLEIVKGWLKQDKPLVIVDPQRKQLVNVKMEYLNYSNAKQELYAAGIIKEGFFKSPMASQETILPFWNKERVAPAISTLVPEEKEEEEQPIIGDLILKVNSSDQIESEAALHQLLKLILGQHYELDKYPNLALPKDKLFSFLKEQISVLEGAQPGKKQDEAIWQALHTLLYVFYKLGRSKEGQKKTAPYQALFQQAMITGAEIVFCLQHLSHDNSNNSALQEEYLGLVSKLEGLIINSGKAQMFSSSLRQVAQEKKSFQKAQTYPGFDTLTEIQQSYFIEFFKMKKLALNEHVKQQWADFAFACCSDPKKIAKLAHLIKFSMDNDIAFDLINNIFILGREKNQTHEANLEYMIKEMDHTHQELEQIDIFKTQAILQAWEQRIGDWSDPHKFNALWNEYEREFLPLIDSLSIADNQSPLSKITILKLVQHMTEIMDRTIKTMKGSPDYDEQLKVQYFSKHLNPYYQLMRKWVSMDAVNQYSTDNTKYSMLKTIDKKFEYLKLNGSIEQLNPSGNFTVSSAYIGSTASFDRQFAERKLTLEDMFTLFHQNIIASTVQLNNSLGAIQAKDLPDEIQPLLSALLSQSHCAVTGISSHFPTLLIELTKPLNNHAASFFVEYNQNTKKTKLTVNYYGHNSQGRMSYISKCAALDAALCGVREIYPAAYNLKKYTLGYCWELSTKQIRELAPHIKKQIQFYSHVTFETPMYVQSGFQRTISDLADEEVSRKRSIKLFKNAKKIESTSEDIETMKEYLTSLKLELRKRQNEPGKKPEGIIKLNEWLSASLEDMNANGIKTVFYQVAIELANRHHSFKFSRSEETEMFYAQWYGNIFAIHRKLGEPRNNKIDEPITDNAKYAHQCKDRIRPHLLAIYEKTQDLLENYNEDDPKTKYYKDAANSAREVLTKIIVHLNTLAESTTKDGIDTFAKECNTVINNALNSDLKQHRGVKKGLLGDIWNALLSLAKTLRVISQERKDYLMSTDSTQKILDLKNTFFEMEQAQLRSMDDVKPKPKSPENP
ncbi:MAG: PEP/pyruvate-binding domain-containing protein [Legionella sp.]|jgi:hypothetical protein